MKHNSTIYLLKGFLMIFLCVLLNASFSFSVKAQSIVTPLHPDLLAAPTNPPADFLSTDIMNFSSGGILKAIYYFENGSPRVQITDNSGGITIINLPSGVLFGDVVLANNGNSQTTYIAGVVFNNNGHIYFNRYVISGAGSGSLSSSPLVPLVLNNFPAVGMPRIDMFVDFNIQIGGLSALHEYVISWIESATGNNHVYAQYGEITNPTTATTVQIATGNFFDADVATTHYANSEKHAYFALSEYNTPNYSLYCGDLNCTTTTPPPPNITFLTSSSSMSIPRIEATGVYVNVIGQGNPWTIACLINQEAVIFNNSNLSGLICSLPYPVLSAYVDIAVGTIPYPSGAQFGNYTIGWFADNVGTKIFITRAIDFITGNISTSLPDYYQVNYNNYGGIALPQYSHFPFSLSSCSNVELIPQRHLFTTWDNGNGSLLYKVTSDVSGYKPTAISQIRKDDKYALYPNPATESLHVPGLSGNTNYKVCSLTGKVLEVGMLNIIQNSVNIKAFAPGLYLLELSVQGKTLQRIEFLKE